MGDESAAKMSPAMPDASPPQRRPRALSPAARRALAEAEERRRLAEAAQKSAPPQELGGRGGLDPARYGDWEINGLTSDF